MGLPVGTPFTWPLVSLGHMLPAKQCHVDINSGLARTLSFTALYVLLDSQMELQIMYAGTKLALKKEANLTRVYEFQELDELTEQWLQEKLCK